jgi:hypothetical protein
VIAIAVLTLLFGAVGLSAAGERIVATEDLVHQR